MKVSSKASLFGASSHPEWLLSLPAGGGFGDHSAGQWTCYRRRRPGGVFSAARSTGGQSEVQNHQRQEGHGQRHVSHILSASGEGGWEEGEAVANVSQCAVIKVVLSATSWSLYSSLPLKHVFPIWPIYLYMLARFCLISGVPVSWEEKEKEQNFQLPHLDWSYGFVSWWRELHW